MAAIQDRILERIRAGRGKVFISKDFLDLANRAAVDQALSRLVRAKGIERIGRGLYYIPRENTRLGIALSPATDEIAMALGRQTGSRVVPSGAVAANQLGLSTQVPARPVYLTNGRTRHVRVNDLILTVKHTAPKEMPPGRDMAAMVFQALRHIGRDAVDSFVLSRLRKALSSHQKRELLQDARYTTDWIAEVVRAVAAEEKEVMTHG